MGFPLPDTDLTFVLPVLTDEEIEAIDKAGAKGQRIFTARTVVRRVAAALFLGAIGLGVCSYLGIDVL